MSILATKEVELCGEGARVAGLCGRVELGIATGGLSTEQALRDRKVHARLSSSYIVIW